ncbi:MAG: helix-turn-helix domain-containing protein [Nitrospinota bacterium]|nr:helix-turn-helix domain-containing protein [Nitrospinota bacterium]MEE3253517.1 helix-turn-helix domain-containing protein [Nitrospinota bacterium]
MNPHEIQRNKKNIHTFLEKWLDKSIKQYVGAMDEKNNGHLHELIIGGIEKPLVEIVLKETNGNQTQAANILGINRNTLRKKIAEYEIKCKTKT